MAEHTEDRFSREELRISPGIPFSITYELAESSIAASDKEYNVRPDSQFRAGMISLDIEKVEKAGIYVTLREPRFETFTSISDPIELWSPEDFGTPAGPIEVQYVLENGKRIFKSLPMSFSVVMNNITKEQVEKIRCSFIYGGNRFEGEALYVEEPRSRSKYYPGTLSFHKWKTPDTQQPQFQYFPRTPEVYQNLQFLVDIER
ncbi:hypothetical protein HYV21_00570 [Candidatus Microgenomates bacterium]|nr:hypothetical protein [Candidatus Microgenomates bacterium]